MLAAHKLYPGSRVAFPGFHEKSMKNFFISTMAYLFDMIDLKKIDKNEIRRLVIVDTRQKNRIGSLADFLDRPGVEVHIYDHHPATAGDIRPDYEIARCCGATVTILTDIISKKEIEVSADEATIMLLGIFEDTGSFTYPSTTPEDFAAAAFLLSRGASLTTISDMISKELEPTQIALLNDMIKNGVPYYINGIDIVVSTVSCDDYIHDLAFLTQKMLKIEDLKALFVIALMKNKIYIAARSRVPEVDVGIIAQEFGGGGHGFAAAATVRDMTLAQTGDLLIRILKKHLKSVQRAGDIMSTPPITAHVSTTCMHARELLSRYNVNALLVIDDEDDGPALRGFISRQVIEKALYHNLGDIPIKEYMTTEFSHASLEADLAEIQKKIIESKQRILPVMEGDVIKGVITRTDLLNMLITNDQKKSAHPDEPGATVFSPRTRNIKKFLAERLSPHVMSLLSQIGTVANQLDFSAYVVGGFVRDLFLFRHNEDIDIVIEGDGIEFARAFARKNDLRINEYARFGTSVIIFPDGFKIDVASARMEYYKFPAALPTVESSSIKLDLFRRDFTVNTLAVTLNPENFGELIDFFGGLRDIKEKAIRILHNLSFVEDPTRVFRAVRFEQRFGFTIGKLTAGLIKNAVKMDFFKQLSGRRVFSKLRHILNEENPIPALTRLNEFDLLKVIDPQICIDKSMADTLETAKRVLSWYDLLYLDEKVMKWAVYFMLLLEKTDFETSVKLCRRFEIPPRQVKMFIDGRLAAQQALSTLYLMKKDIRKSTLYYTLKGFKTELVLYMMVIAKTDSVKRAISLFMTDLKDVRPSVSGRDLKNMEIPPSPLYSHVFKALMAEKLDDNIQTREEELDFIKDYVNRIQNT
ncbi:MAG: CBS domain-containing protein [Deltaproteobacteria bacterium]|nr:CBS domain-containing protein [Deltaproteobacteria bacterium]